MISLKSIKLSNENSKKSKALIMHHGMLGSAKNLRPLCKNSRLLNYVDVLLVDARNHGTYWIIKDNLNIHNHIQSQI